MSTTVYTLPHLSSIKQVQPLIGRLLVTLTTGEEQSYDYERLTAQQENTLRALVPAHTPKPTTTKRSRANGKPRKGVNYAEAILWTRPDETTVLPAPVPFVQIESAAGFTAVMDTAGVVRYEEAR